MSKIGRKSIDISGIQVDVKGQEVHFKGAKNAGVYTLPVSLVARVENNILSLAPQEGQSGSSRFVKSDWGLHRALLANKMQGASTGFEKNIQIIGLGYKATKSGDKKLVFALGYSHKIDFDIPDGVSVDIDKTGQKLIVKSVDKELVGHVCSKIRSLRKPEPYKGTGIRVGDEVIARKAGKTKASA